MKIKDRVLLTQKTAKAFVKGVQQTGGLKKNMAYGAKKGAVSGVAAGIGIGIALGVGAGGIGALPGAVIGAAIGLPVSAAAGAIGGAVYNQTNNAIKNAKNEYRTEKQKLANKAHQKSSNEVTKNHSKKVDTNVSITTQQMEKKYLQKSKELYQKNNAFLEAVKKEHHFDIQKDLGITYFDLVNKSLVEIINDKKQTSLNSPKNSKTFNNINKTDQLFKQKNMQKELNNLLLISVDMKSEFLNKAKTIFQNPVKIKEQVKNVTQKAFEQVISDSTKLAPNTLNNVKRDNVNNVALEKIKTRMQEVDKLPDRKSKYFTSEDLKDNANVEQLKDRLKNYHNATDGKVMNKKKMKEEMKNFGVWIEPLASRPNLSKMSKPNVELNTNASKNRKQKLPGNSINKARKKSLSIS